MKGAGPRMHLIVAVSENMGIGKDNALPWRLKSEMKYFAQMTRTTVNPNKKESGSNLCYGYGEEGRFPTYRKYTFVYLFFAIELKDKPTRMYAGKLLVFF
jgi:hypothetical protein